MYVPDTQLCVEKKNKINATEWFIALIICPTCCGHFYAHHQKLETICVLLPPMVCSALVAGCWRSGAGQPSMRSGCCSTIVEQHPSSRTQHSRATSLIPNAQPYNLYLKQHFCFSFPAKLSHDPKTMNGMSPCQLLHQFGLKQPTDRAHIHSYLKPCRMYAKYIFRLQ